MHVGDILSYLNAFRVRVLVYLKWLGQLLYTQALPSFRTSIEFLTLILEILHNYHAVKLYFCI